MSGSQEVQLISESESKEGHGVELESTEGHQPEPHSEGDLQASPLADNALHVTKHESCQEVAVTRTIVDETEAVGSKVKRNLRGIIHPEAYWWFVPLPLLLILLIVVAWWGVSGRGERNEELFDKIVSGGDKFETIKAWRDAEQHETYYSFGLLLVVVIALLVVVISCIVNRNYVADEGKEASRAMAVSASHNIVQAEQRQKDIKTQLNLRGEVADQKNVVQAIQKEKEAVDLELTKTSTALHHTNERLEAEKTRGEEMKRSYESKVNRMEREQQSTKGELEHQRGRNASMQAENVALRQRTQSLEQEKSYFQRREREEYERANREAGRSWWDKLWN